MRLRRQCRNARLVPHILRYSAALEGADSMGVDPWDCRAVQHGGEVPLRAMRAGGTGGGAAMRLAYSPTELWMMRAARVAGMILAWALGAGLVFALLAMACAL